MIGTTAALILGGAGLLGGGINMAGSALSSRKAYKRQRALMREQMAWQERMANTAHQREVADLKEAGLNPILSANGGNGADIGSTSAPQVNAEDLSQIDVNTAVSNALQATQMKHQNNLMDEQAKTEQMKRDNFVADTEVKKAEKMLKLAEAKWMPKKWAQEIKESASNILKNQATASALQSETNLNKVKQATEKTVQAKNNADTKYTNERSRGYMESWTDSDNKSGDYRFLWGLYGNGGSTGYTRSYSRTH